MSVYGNWRIVAVIGVLLATCAPSAAQSTEQDWLAGGLESVDLRSIGPAEIGFEERNGPEVGSPDLTLPVSAIRLSGTGWTHERVLSHLRRTARILAQCGIALGPVEVVHLQPPGELRDLDMDGSAGLPAPRDVLELAELIPSSAPRPRVFFVGRLRGDQAPARSFRRGDVTVEDAKAFPYLDTAWVSFRTHWMERKDLGYSSVAHELAHLLCECGHTRSRERHLLNRYRNFLSGEVMPQTCEAMRRSALLEPLHSAQ